MAKSKKALPLYHQAAALSTREELGKHADWELGMGHVSQFKHPVNLSSPTRTCERTNLRVGPEVQGIKLSKGG